MPFSAFPHIASIDIGSHSTILLVAKKNGDNLQTLFQKVEVCRIGEDCLEKLSEILNSFRGIAHSLGAEIKAVAMTEATRKAENQNEILQAVEKALWVKPRIISGEEEAKLSYKAISKVYGEGILSVDVGGGSTEFANGKNYISVPVGALALYKKFGAIPSPEYKKWTKETFKEMNLKPFAKRDTYFVGGTAVALGMLVRDLKTFDEKLLEGQTVFTADIERVIIHLSNLSADLRNTLPGLENGRGDLIICGLYWIRSLCEKLKIDSIRISTLGLRFGLLL
ncbi:bifunctional 3-dehydroquinate synthase/phosphatase [Fibrobacterales bacterium]|nr:bifunctional 3-dehydroquinate synthase/phosphatase [Fibrobacterales bacterium]